MEILFPAGNLDYIKSAIECKANAVYGGLKKWNCRNKAANFEIEELKEAIEICHKNNLKFYLTLNTLMFDEEIRDVISIIKEYNINPDAIICADIGLVDILKKKFKNIPLHASTQFGVSNIDDAKCGEKIGFSRIILSRELTADEINQITRATSLEVEVFVWGSQCISFSGACYLGSLCNGGTANRGKCITLCRDKYITPNSDAGNYLYVPDLNCFNKIKEIKNICSLKFEGRRRPTNELKNAVYELRGLNPILKTNGYVLSEDPNKNGLYEKVNNRIKLAYMSNGLSMDKNDVFVKVKNGYLNNYSLGGNGDFYVYTEIQNTFNFNKYNISFDVEQEGGIVKSVMMLTHKGEAFTFHANAHTELTDINNITLSNDLLNLYRVTYRKEFENQQVNISCLLIDEINTFLNKYYSNKDISKQNNSVAINDIYIETTDIEKAKKLSGNNIILNILNVNTLNLINPDEFDDKVIFKLPLFNFKNEKIITALKKMKDRRIMATKISHVFMLEEIGATKVYADFLINVWNKQSLNFLKSHGVKCFCSSPELSLEKNREIFEGENVIHLLAGFPPCVYTRNCFKGSLKCKSCNSDLKNIKNVDRQIEFNIHCNQDHRTLTYKKPILNRINMVSKNEGFRYITRDEPIEQIEKNINDFKQDGYFMKMRTKSFWKDSFCNILKEDK